MIMRTIMKIVDSDLDDSSQAHNATLLALPSSLSSSPSVHLFIKRGVTNRNKAFKDKRPTPSFAASPSVSLTSACANSLHLTEKKKETQASKRPTPSFAASPSVSLTSACANSLHVTEKKKETPTVTPIDCFNKEQVGVFPASISSFPLTILTTDVPDKTDKNGDIAMGKHMDTEATKVTSPMLSSIPSEFSSSSSSSSLISHSEMKKTCVSDGDLPASLLASPSVHMSHSAMSDKAVATALTATKSTNVFSSFSASPSIRLAIPSSSSSSSSSLSSLSSKDGDRNSIPASFSASPSVHLVGKP
eukprot:Awhi_evm1s732